MGAAGFTRRYSTDPGTQVKALIEGVVILDLTPPGPVQGVGSGVVACVGEFPDMTYAVAADNAGGITTSPQPVQVTTTADLIAKTGAFDATLGDFGRADGNGWVALRNKRFAGLVVVPVNLCSSKGVRLYRQLPTNASETLPNPVVPMQAATVAAARQFVDSSGHRVLAGAAASFTDQGAYATAADVSIPVIVSQATLSITSAALGAISGITTLAQPGDAVVLGVQGTDSIAGTYRLISISVTSGTATLVIEQQDGATFSTASAVDIPCRLHPAAAADTGATISSNVAGYAEPARPIDATITGATLPTALAPSTVPPAITATTWDPLSGLNMLVQPGASNGLTYTAAVQAPNAENSASIDALYTSAINALAGAAAPANAVNIAFAARTSPTIRSQLRAWADTASADGIGRSAIVSPEINVVSETQVLGSSDTGTDNAWPAPAGIGGVGAVRDERTDYCWPGLQTFVPEAVNVPIVNAAGQTILTGMLDTRADGWMAAIQSSLAPERSPAEDTDTVRQVMTYATGFQTGAPTLAMADYILLKQAGICAPRWGSETIIFQSAVTTSTTSGQTDIARRRFADFCEDSLAAALMPYAKQPVTPLWQAGVTAACGNFVADLKGGTQASPTQRIADGSVDPVSGNTPTLLGAGIFTVKVQIQMLPRGDVIVLSAAVGPTVVVTRQSAQT